MLSLPNPAWLEVDLSRQLLEGDPNSLVLYDDAHLVLDLK